MYGIYICTCTCISNTCTWTPKSKFTYVPIYIQMYNHSYIYTCMNIPKSKHMYIHIYMYLYMYTNNEVPKKSLLQATVSWFGHCLFKACFPLVTSTTWQSVTAPRSLDGLPGLFLNSRGFVYGCNYWISTAICKLVWDLHFIGNVILVCAL